MERLLLGISLTLWALGQLNLFTISAKFLGVLFLVTGIAYILVSLGVALPSPKRG